MNTFMTGNFSPLRLLLKALVLPLAFGCAAPQTTLDTAPQGLSAKRSDESPYGADLSALLMQPEAQEENPGSLWDESGYERSFGYDRRAKQVGDLVTILIIEETQARREASTVLSRDTESSANISAMMGLDEKLKAVVPNVSPEVGVGGGASSAFNGEGTTERRGSLKATITARVVGELKDGNLIIVGRQEVKVNQEVQLLTVRGIIRPQDIQINNTITSIHIADAQIEYAGAGAIAEKQVPPWGGRIVDKVWPF